MKTGYSNFLGEHVSADEVGYDDCRDFQIVCPCCHEPIFKVERDRESSHVHFFSHYKASKSDTEECERRVGGMTAAERHALEAEGKGQRLDLFLRVINEEVEAMDPHQEVATFRRRLMESKAFMMNFAPGFGAALKDDIETRDDRVWESIFLALEERESRVLSAMEKSMRKRTLSDIVQTLCSGQARPALVRLVAQSAAKALAERPTGEEFPSAGCLAEFRQMMRVCMTESRTYALAMMFSAKKTASRSGLAGPNGHRVTALNSIAAVIHQELVDSLLRLDSVDIVRRRKREQMEQHNRRIAELQADG